MVSSSRNVSVSAHVRVCMCFVLIHLILDIQRAFLFMEEFQGLHVAVSRCVVDSVGSTLKREENSRIYS